MGQQEVHEYEASGGSFGRRLYCRLISFSRGLQTILRINLDGTSTFLRGWILRLQLILPYPPITAVAERCATFRYYCLMRVYARLGLTLTE